MKTKTKKIMASVLGVFMLGLFVMMSSVTAVEVLENGDIILTATEFSSLTDQQIADYMVSQFTITDINLHNDKIEIVYNLVYVEPTHNNNTYRVFNHGYQTYVTYDLLQQCLDLSNMATCVQVLVTNTEAQTFDLGDNETITITPTYVQAFNQGVSKYQQTIELRDSISQMNTMEEFISNIQWTASFVI